MATGEQTHPTPDPRPTAEEQAYLDLRDRDEDREQERQQQARDDREDDR